MRDRRPHALGSQAPPPAVRVGSYRSPASLPPASRRSSSEGRSAALTKPVPLRTLLTSHLVSALGSGSNLNSTHQAEHHWPTFTFPFSSLLRLCTRECSVSILQSFEEEDCCAGMNRGRGKAKSFMALRRRQATARVPAKVAVTATLLYLHLLLYSALHPKAIFLNSRTPTQAHAQTQCSFANLQHFAPVALPFLVQIPRPLPPPSLPPPPSPAPPHHHHLLLLRLLFLLLTTTTTTTTAAAAPAPQFSPPPPPPPPPPHHTPHPKQHNSSIQGLASSSWQSTRNHSIFHYQATHQQDL